MPRCASSSGASTSVTPHSPTRGSSAGRPKRSPHSRSLRRSSTCSSTSLLLTRSTLREPSNHGSMSARLHPVAARARSYGTYARSVRTSRQRRSLPLWALAAILIGLMFVKGLVSGFSLLDTGVAIVLGTAVIALIFGLAYTVERRLNR